MVIEAYQLNYKNKMQYRRELLDMAGILKIQTIISSQFSNGNRLVNAYEGTAQSRDNVREDIDNMIHRAVLNAIYKHRSEGGSSSPAVFIDSYRIKYFENIVDIEEREYYDPLNPESKKGILYMNVTDKQTGKVITSQRKKWINNINEYHINNS